MATAEDWVMLNVHRYTLLDDSRIAIVVPNYEVLYAMSSVAALVSRKIVADHR